MTEENLDYLCRTYIGVIKGYLNEFDKGENVDDVVELFDMITYNLRVDFSEEGVLPIKVDDEGICSDFVFMVRNVIKAFDSGKASSVISYKLITKRYVEAIKEFNNTKKVSSSNEKVSRR